MEGEAPLAQLHVSGRRTVETPKVLGPRLVDDLLDEARRVTDVAQKLPADRTLAQARTPRLLHQEHERLGARRIDEVLHRRDDARPFLRRPGRPRGPAVARRAHVGLLLRVVGEEADCQQHRQHAARRGGEERPSRTAPTVATWPQSAAPSALEPMIAIW